MLLILDNHSSRMDLEELDLALTANVHILLFPPNLTHLLQPGRFRRVCLCQARHGSARCGSRCQRNCDCQAVAGLIWKAWSKGCKRSNIVAAFRKTGVWPFNALAVPDSALPLEPSVAGHSAQLPALEKQEAELAAHPVFGNFLSAPRPSKSKKKAKDKPTTAMVLTRESLEAAIAAKPSKVNAAAAAAKAAAAAGAAAGADGDDGERGSKEEKKVLRAPLKRKANLALSDDDDGYGAGGRSDADRGMGAETDDDEDSMDEEESPELGRVSIGQPTCVAAFSDCRADSALALRPVRCH